MATMGSSKLLKVIFSTSLLLSLTTLTTLLADEEDPYFECRYAEENEDNFTANSTYQPNLNLILSNLSSIKDFNYGFHNLSAGGEGPDKVFATSLCAGDRTPEQCSDYFNYTATKLMEKCPWGKEVVAWSEFCMVRYANRHIFGQLDNDPRTCAYNPMNASDANDFSQTVTKLLIKLSNEAAIGGPLLKYAANNATGSSATSQVVYAAVQCSPDLNEQNCTTCLNFGMSELQMCCAGRLGCRVLRPSCILRFETNDQFCNNKQTAIIPLPAPSPIPSPPSPTSSGYILATITFPIIILQLCCIGLITIKIF